MTRYCCTNLGIKLNSVHVCGHRYIGGAKGAVVNYEKSLWNLKSENGKHWGKHVAHITFHLNQGLHSTLGVSPFSLLHSFKACQILDNVLHIPCDNPSFNQQLKLIEATRKFAAKKLYHRFEFDRRRLLKTGKVFKFHQNQNVLLLFLAYGPNISKKFTNWFTMPA